MNPYDSPENPVPAQPVSPQQAALQAQLQGLQQRGWNGANWFFWIAGLSLVNSVILLSGSDTHFVIGLGVTLVADVIAKVAAEHHPEAGTLLKALAFGFDLVVLLGVVLVGWLARNRYQVIYALGMILYLLDGLIYVLVQDWMSFGFHVFALFCMWSGFTSFRQLNALERELTYPSLAEVPAPANPQGF